MPQDRHDVPDVPHVLIAGGGTGGHVFPGLAVADEMVRRGWRVSWMGRPEGMERRLVPARGLTYHALPARPLLGRGVFAKVGALATLARSALAARRLLGRLDVKAVLGTGGYVSAPAVLAARLAGRPSVLLEPNVEPGTANRWLSRFTSVAAVAWEETGALLACAGRVTGVPVRAAFAALPEVAPGEVRRVLVLGGSQGAVQLNELMPPAVALLARTGLRLTVVHQVGQQHLESARKAWAAALDDAQAEVEVVPFLDDVAAAMGRADVVVSRAGAVTLAEICAAGRPALLVPYGYAGGHQAKNASRLVAAGGARSLAPDEIEPAACAAVLEDLLADAGRLRAMGRALRQLVPADAARVIADLVQEVATA